MSPYPTVVIVTTAHQKASGILLKKLNSLPASAKYTAELKRTTPINQMFYCVLIQILSVAPI
jgi:hypothetical protein